MQVIMKWLGLASALLFAAAFAPSAMSAQNEDVLVIDIDGSAAPAILLTQAAPNPPIESPLAPAPVEPKAGPAPITNPSPTANPPPAAGLATTASTAIAVTPTNTLIAATDATSHPPSQPIEHTDQSPVSADETNVVSILAEELPKGAAASAGGTNEILISISLDDVEMVDVARMFQRISGADIVFSPSNLVGKVTANITDKPWKHALETILEEHNLALMEKIPGSGVYRIAPRPPGSPEPLFTETLFLKYASVSNVITVVNNMIVPQGKVSPFPTKNALIIRSTSSNLEEIKRIIARIDELRSQVAIEAKFVALDSSVLSELGTDWSEILTKYKVGAGPFTKTLGESERRWTENNGQSLTRGEQDQQSRSVSETISEGAIGGVAASDYSSTKSLSANKTASKDFTKTTRDALNFGVLSASELALTLSAIDQNGGATIISNPKVIVANEEAALIHIGKTRHIFKLIRDTSGQSGSISEKYDVGETFDEGVKVRVTPTINTISNITVKIQPELLQFDVKDDVSPDGKLIVPVVNRKVVETVFCLESGKTIAIGGLTKTSDDNSNTKVPLLGDIPLIGKYLFSKRSRSGDRSETVIFVTVTLANPSNLQRSTGIPEDSELTFKHLEESDAKQSKMAAGIKNSNESATHHAQAPASAGKSVSSPAEANLSTNAPEVPLIPIAEPNGTPVAQ